MFHMKNSDDPSSPVWSLSKLWNQATKLKSDYDIADQENVGQNYQLAD